MLISIVVPFYNEEESVALFFKVIAAVIDKLTDYQFEIVCVNDGSKDHTLKNLIAIKQTDPRLKIIDLSRNFGKEAALTAGIDAASGDAVIPIDADLQDPPQLMVTMLEKWREGYEVVLAKRSSRASDTFLKRISANLFYRLQNAVSDYEIPNNVGDYRLLDRKAVDALKQLPERRRFMKGMFAWVGFKTTTLEYVRETRNAGKSKFSGWKLWNFAIEGITSFSTAPLRIWTYIGAGISTIALLYALYIVLRTIFRGVDIPGYASLLTSILFLGGIQLIGIGVIGEYVGRIYYETKQRPVYIVRQIY